MARCFIFTKYLQDEGCLITRFDAQGNPNLESKYYTFAEIRELQKGYETVLIYPCTRVSIIDLALPWLAERKARAAIPFALEDQLTQPIEQLHFAFDKNHYQQNSYEVIVLEKKPLKTLMDTFTDANIDFDIITLDWYALAPNESVFIGETALVYSTDFKGALAPELTSSFQSVFTANINFILKDSKPKAALPNQQLVEELSFDWLSKRLLKSTLLNLCQNDLMHGTSVLQIQKWYRSIAIFAGLWLIIVLVLNAYKLYAIDTELTAVNTQIATIYRKFFPEATQVINPKFRISQLLNNTESSAKSNFWYFINKLGESIKDANVTIEQIRFQNAILLVNVICPDFAVLEKLENRLKQLQLNVTQTQAANRDQQVTATLELK